jgi:adenosylhomocysteine nucleosidase
MIFSERWSVSHTEYRAVTELLFEDACVIFALDREARPFRREFRPQQRFPGAPCWARFCGPAWLTVLVLQTGIGQTRTRTALEWMLSRPILGNVPYRPRVVLSAGFAGALQPGLAVGDIILATEVVDTESNCWPATWPAELPPGEWQPPLRRGRVLTATHLVGDPAEKRALGEKHEAVAVEMESATVARLCSKHAIPFGCVRAISDDWNTPLSPQLVSVLAGGRVSYGRLLWHVLTSPRLTGELWRLARQTKVAAEQLGRALGELLTLTLPWMDESQE